MAILSIIIILFLRPKGSKRLKTAVPFQAGAAGGGGDHFPTSPSPSPEAGVSPELLTVPVSADSQPTSSGTNRKARSASRRPPTPPQHRTAKGQPSSEGEVPQALGDALPGGAPGKLAGGRSAGSPQAPQSPPIPLPKKTLQQGGGEEEASPQDRKAACWVVCSPKSCSGRRAGALLTLIGAGEWGRPGQALGEGEAGEEASAGPRPLSSRPGGGP